MTNEIVVTVALPHGGRPNGSGQLSVYLAPRARGGARLGDTDWRDWPAIARGLAFTVQIDGISLPPNQVSVVSPQPDSAIWAAVFGADTPWRPWQFTDRRDRPYLTLAEGDLHDDVVAAYLGVANAFPTTIPTVSDLAALPDVADLLGAAGVARERLAQARQFTTRSPGATGDGGGQGVDTIDFNQALSLLARHPRLLRLLGIVVDLEVKLPSVFNRVAVQTTITTVLPTVRELSPQTCLRPDFWSNDGFEDLSSAALTQIDVLGAAGSLSEFVRTFSDSDGPAPLPSLQEFGVAITRPDAPALLNARALQMAGIERDLDRLLRGTLDAITLCDTDLVIGHRIDVSSAGAAYRSLHQRRTAAGYRFPRDPGLKVVPDPDESWVSTTLGTETTDTASQQRARPVLHRWSGWSAAAPPPGRVLDPSTGKAVESAPSSPVPGPVQFAVDYQVRPGTLPRLRYGSRYVLRARQVDISGVSRDVTDPGGDGQLPPPITFGRWSAVASPSLVRRELAPIPGVDDTPTQLVIKSELDGDDATLEPTDRLIFPPVGTQQLAERHGLPGGGAAVEAYADLAERDGRSLTDDTTADPVTAERIVVVQLPGGEVTPGPAQQEVSYLTDPPATGVGFTGAPGIPGTLVVPWPGVWPALSTKRLILAAGPEGTTLVDDDEAVEVRLPKAGRIDVEVACTVKSPFVDHFGLVQVMREGRSAGQVARLDQVVGEGRLWLVSARKTVTLIHAVRVPLAVPAVSSLRAERQLGGRQAHLVGRLSVDRASTRRVTLRGSWTDPVDIVTEAGPREVAAQAVIGKVSVDRDGRPAVAPADLPWRLDDTRHREVEVSAEAFSRFSRHFTEQRAVEVTDDATLVELGELVLGSLVVSDGPRTYTLGVDYLADEVSGVLTRVEGGSLLTGSTVTVRWIPRPTSRRSDEGGAAPFLLDVPNTRAPLPPDVLETLPACLRSPSGGERAARVRHLGSVIRVWLGRGWFDSGAGELLGVVCDVAGSPGGLTRSVAGKDPLFTAAEPAAITAERLTSTFTVSAGLPAPDGGRVDVAGHRVSFDADSGRWYADVVIDDDRAYLPFVRLVLCRLQPHSVVGAHLSPLIVTDPVRLGPTRTTVVQVADDGAAVDVRVEGRSHLGVPDPGLPAELLFNRVTAWLEERDSGVGDPDLGWSVVVGPVDLERRPRGRDTLWRRLIRLPGGGVDPDAVIRVRLEESEPLLTGPQSTPTAAYKPVFVETIPVPLGARADR